MCTTVANSSLALMVGSINQSNQHPLLLSPQSEKIWSQLIFTTRWRRRSGGGGFRIFGQQGDGGIIQPLVLLLLSSQMMVQHLEEEE